MTAYERLSQVVDPSREPERANELVDQLVEAKSQPPPLMAGPPTNVVTMPGGYLDENGQLHKEAHIREVTGKDEEQLARELRNPNVTVAGIVDMILRRTITSIGTLEATPQLLGELLIGDRSALLLAVRILTFGSDWEVPDWPCRLCGQTFGVVIELEKDIEVQSLPNPSIQEFDVKLRHGHVATVGLITGAIQMAMAGDGDRTGPEEQTIAINRCLRRYDGQPVRFPMGADMGMADRRTLIKAMEDAQPGPQLEGVMVQCEKCGGGAGYAVSLIDLFR
jgi:hypothetical protein